MGTKGPKAGNIFTSLRGRGLVGGQGQDPSIKGMGSPFKQTKDGSDASLYGKAKAALTGMAKNLGTGLGQGNRHMDGPARQQPQEQLPSKPDLSSKAKTSQPSKSKDNE